MDEKEKKELHSMTLKGESFLLCGHLTLSQPKGQLWVLFVVFGERKSFQWQ